MKLQAISLGFYYPGGDAEAFWSKVRSSPEYAGDLAEIRAEGERLLAAPAQELSYLTFSLFHTQGSRLEFEQIYFEKRRRLNTFALLSLLEPESERYHTALLDAIWSICSELTWCLPAHVSLDKSVSSEIDLFLAETGFTLAELRLLLGDRLPEILRSRIAELVEERLFRPFLEQGPYSWEEAEHNWSAVCAGSIGSAAMLLLDSEEDAGRLARILEKTERSMEFYLRGFGKDGACLEGLGYWNYGFGYFVYYADLLLKRSGGQQDWFQREQVRSVAGFQQKCFLGGDAVANFSDALPHAAVHLGLSRYLASKYEEVEPPPIRLRADYRDDHCSRWAPALRNLLWREERETRSDWGPIDVYLEDAGWFVSRVAADAGVFGWAAKGGHNDEPHNHNDLGQFKLAHDGEFYLSDLGCGEYTKDYFRDEGRYDYACNGSQGHAVPIIDGVLQAAGRSRQAQIREAKITEMEDKLTMELSSAYPLDELTSFTRSWSWHKSKLPSLVLQDEFCFKAAPGSLTERFVTLLPPVLAAESGLIVLPGREGKAALELRYNADLLRPEISRRTFRDHFGRDAVWYTVDFHALQLKRTMRFQFQFQFVLYKLK